MEGNPSRFQILTCEQGSTTPKKKRRRWRMLSTAPVEPSRYQPNLEKELRPEPDVPGAAVLHVRIGEADELAREPGIVDERIDSLSHHRTEVRMIKGIGKVRMELQAIPLRNVDRLEDRQVEHVGVEVPQAVAPRIAKRRAEQLVGNRGVGDVAYRAAVDERWRGLALIDGIEADQLCRAQRATDAINAARISRINSDGIRRSGQATNKRPQRSVRQRKPGIEVRVVGIIRSRRRVASAAAAHAVELHLRWRKRLARRKCINAGDRPATESMAEPPVLRTVEGQLLNDSDYPIVREIQSGEAILLPRVVDLALGNGVGAARREVAKDLAGVVQGFAEGVRGF